MTTSALLYRIDPSRNMARYYGLTIEPTLFGETVLRRAWGRIGRRGGEKCELCADEASAAAALQHWLKAKQRRGYVPAG